MTNLGHCSSFGFHIADGDVAPGFCIRGLNRGGGELSHLSSSLLVSICRCWPSFVSGGVICVHFWVFFVIWGCVVAHDVVLPHCCWLFHCWLCAMVVGSRWQQWLLGMVVTQGVVVTGVVDGG